MRVNPLTGGTSFGGREGRKARRKQAIKSKKIGDRLLGVKRVLSASLGNRWSIEDVGLYMPDSKRRKL